MPTLRLLDVINPATNAWFNATKASRADMLLIGDSVVWHGGNGWYAGFINALSNRTGLAATWGGDDEGGNAAGEEVIC